MVHSFSFYCGWKLYYGSEEPRIVCLRMGFRTTNQHHH